MSILSDQKIVEAALEGDIFISNFNMEKLNPNGYNLSLNNKLLVYTDEVLDMKNPNPTKELIIPREGLVLYPGQLYLGMTNEYTKTCAKYVPMLEGRSSTGRLGIDVHICAGAGDAGFEGNWTLEIRVVKPVRIYADVDVCQIMFHSVEGEVKNPYNGKYQGSKEVKASQIYKDSKFNDYVVQTKDISPDEIKKSVYQCKFNDIMLPVDEDGKFIGFEESQSIYNMLGSLLNTLKKSNDSRIYFVSDDKVESVEDIKNEILTGSAFQNLSVPKNCKEYKPNFNLVSTARFVNSDKSIDGEIVHVDSKYDNNTFKTSFKFPDCFLKDEYKDITIIHSIYI